MDAPVVMPNTSPAQHLWLCSVRFAFTPTEDLLGPASGAGRARAFQAVADELAGWTRLAGGLRAFLLRPPLPGSRLARAGFACSRRAAGAHAPAPANQPLPPLYARLAADWQVDHWRFRAVELDTPDYGEPRASFDSPNVVLGSPEALAFGQAARAACAQAGKDKAALDTRYQADLAQATRPGTVFRGQLTHRGQTVPAEVRFLPPAVGSGGDPTRDVDLEVRLPATPGESFLYGAQRASQVPLGSATATVDAAAPEPLADQPTRRPAPAPAPGQRQGRALQRGPPGQAALPLPPRAAPGRDLAAPARRPLGRPPGRLRHRRDRHRAHRPGASPRDHRRTLKPAFLWPTPSRP